MGSSDKMETVNLGCAASPVPSRWVHDSDDVTGLDTGAGISNGVLSVASTSESAPQQLECVAEGEVAKKRHSRRGGRKKRQQHTAADNKESSDISMAVLHCLKPRGVGKHTAPDKLARELTRCLSEVKYMLILDVINVLGVDKTLRLFYETVSIQENGGELTTDGTRRKNPGGVFFSLVKKTTTIEQQRAIFQKDRKMQAQRKREAQRRRIQEREQKIIEQKKQEEELSGLRQERNIHKRLYGRNCTESISREEEEDMEVSAVTSDEALAEQFELMNHTDLNDIITIDI